MNYKPLTSTAILDDCVKFNGKSVVGCFLTCLGFLFYIVKKFFCSWMKDEDPQLFVPTVK